MPLSKHRRRIDYLGNYPVSLWPLLHECLFVVLLCKDVPRYPHRHEGTDTELKDRLIP